MSTLERYWPSSHFRVRVAPFASVFTVNNAITAHPWLLSSSTHNLRVALNITTCCIKYWARITAPWSDTHVPDSYSTLFCKHIAEPTGGIPFPESRHLKNFKGRYLHKHYTSKSTTDIRHVEMYQEHAYRTLEWTDQGGQSKPDKERKSACSGSNPGFAQITIEEPVHGRWV